MCLLYVEFVVLRRTRVRGSHDAHHKLEASRMELCDTVIRYEISGYAHYRGFVLPCKQPDVDPRNDRHGAFPDSSLTCMSSQEG